MGSLSLSLSGKGFSSQVEKYLNVVTSLEGECVEGGGDTSLACGGDRRCQNCWWLCAVSLCSASQKWRLHSFSGPSSYSQVFFKAFITSILSATIQFYLYFYTLLYITIIALKAYSFFFVSLPQSLVCIYWHILLIQWNCFSCFFNLVSDFIFVFFDLPWKKDTYHFAYH